MKHFILSFVLLMAGFSVNSQTSTLNRPNDPLVLTGASLPSFSGLTPSQIVGFKYVNSAWVQIPIQIDERALIDIVIPYGPIATAAGYPPSPSNPKVMFYCDANTLTGADPTATFDSDDELVFMVKDAGGRSNGSFPTGVVNASYQEITITNPFGGIGYVYLFQHNGTLQQGAGISYINYTSNLSSTLGFPINLNTTNTENTTISTSKYSWHFSSEWVSDEFKIAIGNNVDLLDRYKNFFANGNCVRHEDLFSANENAYVTAKAGPIRAIRSYMGAVSGPLTQRTHKFYEARHDIATDLRVHNIASIYDAFDYNSAANGMTYTNSLNTTGVIVNGQADVVNLGDIQWEQVTGTQGTISIVHRRTTNLTENDATFTSYYDDNSITPASNCTGDNQAWSTSGLCIAFANANVCTDPMAEGCAGTAWQKEVQSSRIVYVDAANATATTASTYNTALNNPLKVAISAYNTISTSSNPPAGGSTTGSGTYTTGANVTLTATANTAYKFVNWTENTNIVSTNASYTFPFMMNRNLKANFEFTQSPQKLSFQTVIRNSSTNQLISNSGIGMQVSILKGSETAAAVYIERHTSTTNINGLASIEIGSGTVISGTFSTIDWSDGTYYIKTETDPNTAGGTAYTLSVTSQMASVPYALFSAQTTQAANGLIPGTAVGDMNYWNGSAWVLVPAGRPGQVLMLSTNSEPIWYGYEP